MFFLRELLLVPDLVIGVLLLRRKPIQLRRARLSAHAAANTGLSRGRVGELPRPGYQQTVGCLDDGDIGLRHDLDVINVMAPDGSISNSHGWDDSNEECAAFIGLSREDARVAIIDWFRAHELLGTIHEYSHSVGHSYRSHAPIEPYLSEQWYVRVTDDRLGVEALRAMAPDQHQGEPPARPDGSAHEHDGQLRFTPERYAKTFQSWHEKSRTSLNVFNGHCVNIGN